MSGSEVLYLENWGVVGVKANRESNIQVARLTMYSDRKIYAESVARARYWNRLLVRALREHSL